ncbi:ATP-dependent DNA helicase [Halopenitus persicus]|uniref:DNA excision repair protein ERCC-2 n=1 Tax=Halopenitus persicus TaxID=1048396 RepID=A0A1H3JRV8_9EURY|nr:ATP-dependent DNA helicase [Halopenitus persicus]QHS15784.1 ATP-dependent DNA helicase [haloarchaeon 3A1-DGR]SDY42108.1 DNA excision repair protein ERCC-2 [Halopenitus persicus]
MSSQPPWSDVFGHAEPYPEQAEGIDAAIEAADEGGFLALEGACGTGKTMLALTAGIDRVRDPDSPFERVFVLTSVKQQLRQFEEDLQTINENLPEDHRRVSGITLVGKADVCPYARENRGGIDVGNVYERCEGLRDRTRSLVGDGGSTTAESLAASARSQQIGLADSGGSTGANGTGGADFLTVDDEPTPYRPDTEEHEGVEYCPFYAGFLADLPEDGEPAEAVPFDATDRGHVDAAELVRLAAGAGSCPHSVMGALVPELEVVIGNYYHAFDPTTTGSFTGALLDESTFVVCDEAHMLEPRVRDLVSDGVADRSLRDAIDELTRVVQPVRFDEEGQYTDEADVVRGELADSDVAIEDVERVREFYEALRGELDRRVTEHLDRELPDWRADPDRLDDAELPLRDPDSPGVDAITEWADANGYGDRVWARAPAVGAVVERILRELEGEDAQRAAPGVGRTLNAWYREDHETFFRAIDLERTWDETEPPDDWRRVYNARFALFNCLPSRAIGERLGEFGGGVLMSATLEPMDVFREVTGLDHLAESGRPVLERTHGLAFPPENRESLAVDVPKYTHDNRGAPGEETETRLAHLDATLEVARRPGNVLVGMPNYAEAEWMAGELDDRLEKPVLIDESSGDHVTESLKDDFFAGDGKVLVTSLRGTLTEGVDYRGDRLRAAVVCGVPIINTARPRTRAVVAAYDERFGDGFETALTVPAVRKARQAVGRVIRGADERGVRVLLDARYARDSWNGVREYLPEHERAEFQPVSPDMLGVALDRFERAE